MNAWASRHRAVLTNDLEDGEELLAAHRVVINDAEDGSPPVDVDVPDGPVRWGRRVNPPRRGLKYRVERARSLGFELPGAIFVLGVSNRRVLFWEASPMLALPTRLAASMPLSDVGAMPLASRFGRIRLGLLREDRKLLVVQPLWSRKLRELTLAFRAATGTT